MAKSQPNEPMLSLGKESPISVWKGTNGAFLQMLQAVVKLTAKRRNLILGHTKRQKSIKRGFFDKMFTCRPI
jgi:hypothetical protein